MERMEQFGVPRWIVSFVIPTGYSFNMTGSSIYLSMAALFAAQAAGILSPSASSSFFSSRCCSPAKASAACPARTLVILIAITASIHIPSTAVIMLLGVDTLMDMGRTSMNVVGNCMAAAVVASWEGELKLQRTRIRE